MKNTKTLKFGISTFTILTLFFSTTNLAQHPKTAALDWLEDQNSAATKEWLQKQKERTETFTSKWEKLPQIHKRLKEIWSYESVSNPIQVADKIFFRYDDGKSPQRKLYIRKANSKDKQLLIDPKDYGSSDDIAIGRVAISPHGKYIAFSIIRAGSDWTEWRVKNTDTKKELQEVIYGVKWEGPAWRYDESGFYIPKYPKRFWNTTEVSTDQAVYFHKLDTSADLDTQVFKAEDPTWVTYADTTDDGKYLGVFIRKSADDICKIGILDIQDVQKPLFKYWLVDHFKDQYYPIGYRNGSYFMYSTEHASNGKILEYKLQSKGFKKSTLLNEQPYSIQGATVFGSRIHIQFYVKGQIEVSLFDLKTKKLSKLKVPPNGVLTGFSGYPGAEYSYFGFQSLARPNTVYRWNTKTDAIEKYFEPELKFSPDDYSIELTNVASRDGTKIPVYVARKKSSSPQAPTILYAYGCYGYPTNPEFSPEVLAWMERGGQYVVAQIRGGGEMGEKWHQAAVREKKQTSIDDHAAVAKWLKINRKTTSVVSRGGSCGGLLVAASAIQNPTLFNGVIAEYGIYDLNKYHLASGAALWKDEIGSVEKPKEKAALEKLSPLMQIKEGTKYPPFFMYTGLSDVRVVPWHTFKLAEALELNDSEQLHLLRVEPKGGHGYSGLSKEQIQQLLAEEISFADAVSSFR